MFCEGEEVVGCVLVRSHAELMHKMWFIRLTKLLQNIELTRKPLDRRVSLCYSFAQRRNAVRPVLLRNYVGRLRSPKNKVSIIDWRRNRIT